MTGRSRGTGSGAARSRCGAPTTPQYPRIDVYGSFEELERDFGRLPLNEHGEPDLHRPFVDHLTRPNPDDPTGNSTMRRVEDVLDVWFDSGSMSFAQVHYPFENADWFEHHFPGDFIVEYIGQTRGWFYTLHVLATALFDRPAFSSCVSHGIVLGSDGQKMSKSLKNYPDVTEVFNRDGADAMRWFLMSSGILRGSNLVVTEEGIREGVRQVLIPLWNSWYFFSLYANAANGGQGYAAQWSTASTDPLDRYLLAKLRDLVETVAGPDGRLRHPGRLRVGAPVRRRHDELVHPPVTGTVLGHRFRRRVRRPHAAFDTLYTTLEVLTRVAAPLLPLVTEEIWRGLTGGRSVHLEDWPDAGGACRPTTRSSPRWTRCGPSAPRAPRCARPRSCGCACRCPSSPSSRPTPRAAALRRHRRRRAQRQGGHGARRRRGARVRLRHQPAARRQRPGRRPAPGPRRADRDQGLASPATGRWPTTARSPPAGSRSSRGSTSSRPSSTPSRPGSHATAMLAGGGFVVLDTDVTPELELEGAARDLVRAVQQARREAGLEVSDRISLEVAGAEFVYRAVLNHRDLVTGRDPRRAPVGGARPRRPRPRRRRRHRGRRGRALPRAPQGHEALSRAAAGGSTPAVTHAAYPPTTSVARSTPTSRRAAAARLEV